MQPSPNEKGGGIDDARRLESSRTATIVASLRKINALHRGAWLAESRRLLREFQRSGNPKHLHVFVRHCAGIGERLAANARNCGVLLS
jgi:hypothetical protein